MARLHDSRHGSDADGIDDDDMPLTHEQAVVEADAELRRMTYHPVRKAVGIVVAMGVAIGASLGVGYMFGGDPGGIVTAITGVRTVTLLQWHRMIRMLSYLFSLSAKESFLEENIFIWKQMRKVQRKKF